MEQCPHIKFEMCSGEVLFRGKNYMMCSAGVSDFNAFTASAMPFPQGRRTYFNRFEYNGNIIELRKSDYGRTKLFTAGRNQGITLYIAMSETFYDDDKVVFTMETQYSNTVQNAIHKFNYNLCQNCSDKECNKVLMSDEVAATIMLSEDLFNI